MLPAQFTDTVWYTPGVVTFINDRPNKVFYKWVDEISEPHTCDSKENSNLLKVKIGCLL